MSTRHEKKEKERENIDFTHIQVDRNMNMS